MIKKFYHTKEINIKEIKNLKLIGYSSIIQILLSKKVPTQKLIAFENV